MAPADFKMKGVGGQAGRGSVYAFRATDMEFKNQKLDIRIMWNV